MPKKILTVGFELHSESVKNGEFTSKTSLLDWDIFLFKPVIDEFTSTYDEKYLGKHSLNDTISFQLKEACEHWRREIKQAFETGKTIIAFLPAVNDVYIDTGERRHSGTGRNQKTTRIVGLYSNYNTLPISLTPVNATGASIKLTPLGTKVLAPFWAEFESVSEYKVLLSSDAKGVCLTTKTGDKPVGSIIRSQTSSGTLVLLPDIDFSPKRFFRQRDGQNYWTPEAKQFASQLISAVVALDKTLHATAEVTTEPTWAADSDYALALEEGLRADLLESEHELEEAQKKKETTLESLRSAGRLRALLYEKGKPLENVIIEALQLLGFQAAPYKEGGSEFDVVFESSEGRLLGEAEGKDNKAINVDKLRQLAMNIHEDLQREEVKVPAKGVLFGNGFRLLPPNEREVQFTEKCISASLSSNTALVSTSELYRAVQYLTDQKDADYARACREAILVGSGLTTLPVNPLTPLPGNNKLAG